MVPVRKMLVRPAPVSKATNVVMRDVFSSMS
jgi:hypothetical protein